MTKISLDFEVAGVLDLEDVGADEWTRDPATIPLLCGFAVDYADPVVIQFDNLGAAPSIKSAVAGTIANVLLHAVSEGAEIHAWNASFEFQVWNNICAPRFNWPVLPIERFHCTMSAAACAGLPMSLDDAATAINSPYSKDAIGHALMLRMTRPRRIDSKGKPVWWHRGDPEREAMLTPLFRGRAEQKTNEMLRDLIAYNISDVRAEREIHLRTPRMSPREREIWLTDQRMNLRGLPVDRDLLTRMHVLTLQEILRLGNVIDSATHGEITSTTQNARIIKWAQDRGYPYTTLERETLQEFVRTPEFDALDFSVREVIDARAEASKTSTAKLKSVDKFSRTDGRARNLVQYGGAVRTLRWAGRGPQIQNFPRPTFDHIDEAISEIKQDMDAISLRHLFGRPLDVISSCLRGVFATQPGKTFVIADYHAIEAIVLAWLADFEPVLKVFREGKEDIYTFTANSVGSNDRQLGKVLRLACGYGMGHVKFQDTANKAPYWLDMSLHDAHIAVQDFRQANGPIVALWHACEACAKSALLNPTTTYQFKKLKFRMADPNKRLAGALLMELPSGRNLVYRNARLDQGRICFHGVHQLTRRWRQLDTYGGKLVENATQAVARDLLADAIVKFDTLHPGALCTTVHDEIIAECAVGDAPTLFADMKTIMHRPPAWGAGLPLSAKGAIRERYAKI